MTYRNVKLSCIICQCYDPSCIFCFHTVFDGNVSPGENYNEERLQAETDANHPLNMSQTAGETGEVEVRREEEPPKVETQVEDTEEVLEDGTIHHTHRVRRQSLKLVRKSLRSEGGEERVVEEKEEIPGTRREDVVETFEEPARMVHEEHVEEMEENGRMVQKQVVTQRVMHHIRTHQTSFDEGGGRQEEKFEIDEVVPGTETTFVTSLASSSTTSSDDDESTSSVHSEQQHLQNIEESVSGEHVEGAQEEEETGNKAATPTITTKDGAARH